MGEYDKKPVQAKAAPTAGPSEDDRFGAGTIGSNLSARIIKVDIVNGKARITIAKGTKEGARVGMEGYIKSAEGALATFQIHEAKEAVSYAFADVTPDQLRDTPTVVINPTAKNAPRNQKVKPGDSSRVIGVNVVEGKTRITIARGSLHGVTNGMQCKLQGNLGNDGATFEIEYASDRVSYAFVKGTVDDVQAHGFVIFQPSASPSRPVQRRASGASPSTGDVQSTAEAGVAGASSRLPFFDTIQRSFGKHDISGVQAQVGGAATTASQALGAQAYATGNRVAFASAPDLHTAAHEAAHTVQQSRGAVGFQGLGAADDEHERHADAVADAVVAGQSAEPLLDQLAGGGSAGAVQRKPTVPLRMAVADQAMLVELILQQTAEAARSAMEREAEPELLTGAMLAVSRASQALAALEISATSSTSRATLVMLDAAYVALEELQIKMSHHPNLESHRAVVASTKKALSERFEPLGWKVPASPKDSRARALVAKRRGGEVLTTHERAQLGILRVRAARQYVLSGWKDVEAGKVQRVSASVAMNLREAVDLFVDPNVADESTELAAEVDAAEDVLERLFLITEEKHAGLLPSLEKLAQAADALGHLVGHQPRWLARTQTVSPTTTTSTPPVPSHRDGTPPAVNASPKDVVGAVRVDGTVAHKATQKPNTLAGVEVDPLVAQGGAKCEREKGENCFLDTRQRDVLVSSYQQRVDAAQKEFHAALAELRVDTLLAKEKQEDTSWVASLLLDVLSFFVVSKLAAAVKVLRAAGISRLDAMIADDYQRDLSADPIWKYRAANLLEKLSDKQIESAVKSGVSKAKGAVVAGVRAKKQPETSKGSDLTFLDMFRTQANLGFNNLKVDVAAAANDAELLALYETFDIPSHQKDPYKSAIEDKLGRFRASGIKKIGRRYEDASDGRRVIRDVRVVWQTYASGHPMELAFEHQDAYRPAQDQYRKPGPVPIEHELRDVVKVPGKPDESTQRTFGSGRSMTDEPVRGVSDAPKSAAVVPTEFVEVALAFHEQTWGEKPRIVHIDDRKWVRHNAAR